MTRTSKKVKLYFYIHEHERTIVDSFEADDWGDFLVVRIKGLNDKTEAYGVYDTMRQHIAQLMPNKQFIIVPDALDIEFYGVEIEIDDE